MLKNLVIIFIMHFVAGYFLQSKKISKLKREKKRYLFQHVGMYTLFFIILTPLLLNLTLVQGLIYSLLNGVFHLIVDYTTGKFKTKFADKESLNYKLTVGVDYTLHLSILMLTYIYFVQNSIGI